MTSGSYATTGGAVRTPFTTSWKTRMIAYAPQNPRCPTSRLRAIHQSTLTASPTATTAPAV
jgi:hypothetical protein